MVGANRTRTGRPARAHSFVACRAFLLGFEELSAESLNSEDRTGRPANELLGDAPEEDVADAGKAVAGYDHEVGRLALGEVGDLGCSPAGAHVDSRISALKAR